MTFSGVEVVVLMGVALILGIAIGCLTMIVAVSVGRVMK